MDGAEEAVLEGLGSLLETLAAIWRFQLAVIDRQPITVGTLVLALLLLVIGILVSRFASRSLGRFVVRRFRLAAGPAAALETLGFYLLAVAFTISALQLVKFPLTAFTIVGGALAIGVGFGSQNVMSNFISGLILMIERPVRPGDLVLIEGTYGQVERIGPRSTRIRNTDATHMVVPNSFFLENNLINWTLSDDLLRSHLSVGVIYGSPTRQVDELIRLALAEHPRVLETPGSDVIFSEFGDNSLVFDVYYWIRARTPMDRRRVASDLRFRIDDLFREAGIVIAFPQRDVHLDSARPIEVRLLDTRSGGTPPEEREA
jgi:small-conductance mechanosensitive channel